MFFFFHSLKGSCFIHLVLQSGPTWPMTRYCVHCTLHGKTERDDSQRMTHKTVGGLNYVLDLEIVIWHHNLSTDHQRNIFPKWFQVILSISDHWCSIWFYQQQASFQECLFCTLACMGYLMRFAFQLRSICFTTKMHLYFGSASTFWTLSFHRSFQSMSA